MLHIKDKPERYFKVESLCGKCEKIHKAEGLCGVFTVMIEEKHGVFNTNSGFFGVLHPDEALNIVVSFVRFLFQANLPLALQAFSIALNEFGWKLEPKSKNPTMLN